MTRVSPCLAHMVPFTEATGRDTRPSAFRWPASLCPSSVRLLCLQRAISGTPAYVLGGNPAGGPVRTHLFLRWGWVASSQHFSNPILQVLDLKPCVGGAPSIESRGLGASLGSATEGQTGEGYREHRDYGLPAPGPKETKAQKGAVTCWFP